MATQVIILNGGSSSGKSGIVRCLQAVLPEPWLTFGCDSFIEALPAKMQSSEARAGARIIIDDVFLGGAASQERWRKALTGLPALWVAVRCDSATASGREIARGDRAAGMAATQAGLVHEGVSYDLNVDTTHTESLACARVIARHVSGG